MAAVLLYIKDNISKTDVKCSWINPSKKPKLLESNIAKFHTPYLSKQSADIFAGDEDKENLFKGLDPTQAFGLSWLCSPSPPDHIVSHND